MRYILPLIFLLGCSAATGQDPVSRADAENIEQQLKSMPEHQTEAARSAIKRVVLLRMMFLVQASHRNTPEHDAECLALARRLQAPEAYVSLLEAETLGPLSGRDYYEHNKAVDELMRSYRVDALSARLLAERVRCNEQQARELMEWLPVQFVFNTIPDATLNAQDYGNQLRALRDLFERMHQQYAKVTDRASADTAADSLLECLPWIAKTGGLRLLISERRSTDLPGYRQIVHPTESKLNEQRSRLVESNFYGSKKLDALDELLCL